MIVTSTPPSTVRTASAKPTPPAPPTPPTTPTTPDPAKLAAQFTEIAELLTSSDETITKMVTDKSTVGAGWGPHMVKIATRLQAARDGLLQAKPAEAELSAKLGTDILRLAEAGGSLGAMSRQRATLSEGWSSFLDTAIADAQAAAALLVPPTTPAPAPPATTPPVNPPK